jgi:hypothetical protein
MSEMPLSADPQAYLENLMRAGQDAMKRYDDALASAAGVQTAEYLSSGRPPFPFALIADLQRDYAVMQACVYLRPARSKRASPETQQWIGRVAALIKARIWRALLPPAILGL